MKVCFIVGTLGRGGAEKQLVFMLRALKKSGIGARVLCLTKGEAYEDEIRRLGVGVEWVGETKNRAARLLKIIGKLRGTPFDIIQSSHFYTNIYAGAAGRFLKIPSVGAVRSDFFYELASHNFFGRWQISLPKILITNSVIARQRLLERGISPQRIEFVRNAVEIDDSGGAKNGFDKKPLKILFAGRLDENKRPERFVSLASSLSRKFPHRTMQFLIAGDGPLRAGLEVQARARGLLPERLKFLGVCGNMGELYNRADILVSTSEREGTPNVVLEAMAHGLAVVATKAGGTAEILDESRGILTAPGDARQLHDAVGKLVEDKNLRLRLGAEARRYAAENHSPDYLQKHLTEIYEKLITKRK